MKTQSDTIGKISGALSKAQVEFEPIIKDVKAHHHKFSPLPVCLKSTRKALYDNGLSVTQPVNILDDGRSIIETTLSHSSGEFFKSYTDLSQIMSNIKAPNLNAALHGWGSTITYTRRYAYLAIIGAASEDEDNDGHVEVLMHKNYDNKSQIQNKYNHQEQVKESVVEPFVVQLIGLIKSSGCDITEFTKFHHISSSDLISVKKSIDNFDELLINFKNSQRVNVDDEKDS